MLACERVGAAQVHGMPDASAYGQKEGAFRFEKPLHACHASAPLRPVEELHDLEARLHQS